MLREICKDCVDTLFCEHQEAAFLFSFLCDMHQKHGNTTCCQFLDNDDLQVSLVPLEEQKFLVSTERDPFYITCKLLCVQDEKYCLKPHEHNQLR